MAARMPLLRALPTVAGGPAGTAPVLASGSGLAGLVTVTLTGKTGAAVTLAFPTGTVALAPAALITPANGHASACRAYALPTPTGLTVVAAAVPAGAAGTRASWSYLLAPAGS